MVAIYCEGCSNDLAKATELAYMYVKHLGMNDKVSLISASDKIKTSEKYDYMIDMEVKKILQVSTPSDYSLSQESYDRVKKNLKTNEESLKLLATELVKRETMTAAEVKTLLNMK